MRVAFLGSLDGKRYQDQREAPEAVATLISINSQPARNDDEANRSNREFDLLALVAVTNSVLGVGGPRSSPLTCVKDCVPASRQKKAS
jgi:hypothetical protein